MLVISATDSSWFAGDSFAFAERDKKVTTAAIRDILREEGFVPLPRRRTKSIKRLITHYAQRILIENALSDAVRFFHMNALSSAVALKVDFDLALLVVASGLYRRFANRMRGYADAQERRVFRDLIDLPATVKVTPSQIKVTFRRAHLPILLASDLFAQNTHRALVEWRPVSPSGHSC
ncbi:MAG: hypothetical protein AB9866_27700 [Syntrophobacteraceae bacterium]